MLETFASTFIYFKSEKQADSHEPSLCLNLRLHKASLIRFYTRSPSESTVYWDDVMQGAVIAFDRIVLVP